MKMLEQQQKKSSTSHSHSLSQGLRSSTKRLHMGILRLANGAQSLETHQERVCERERTQVTSSLEKNHLVILSVLGQISVSSFIPGEG